MRRSLASALLFRVAPLIPDFFLERVLHRWRHRMDVLPRRRDVGVTAARCNVNESTPVRPTFVNAANGVSLASVAASKLAIKREPAF